MNNFLHFFKHNSIGSVLDSCVKLIYGLLLFVVASKYLDKHDFGMLILCLAFTSFFLILSKLSIDNLVLKDISELKKIKSRQLKFYYGSIFCLLIFAVLISFFLNIIFFQVFFNNYFEIFCISFILFGSLNIFIDQVLHSEQQSIKVFRYRIKFYFISFFLKFYILSTGHGFDWFLLSYIFDSFLLIIFFIFYYFKTQKIKIEFFKLNICLKYLKISYPIYLSGLTTFFIYKIDDLMIASLASPYDLADYGVAFKFVDAFSTLTYSFLSSLVPYFIYKKYQKINLYKQSLKYTLYALVIFSILVTIFLLFFAPVIINMIFDDKFFASSKILIILSGFFPILAISIFLTRYFIIENKIFNVLYFNSITGVINICLNYIFFNLYGIIGIAYSTVISSTLSLIVCYLLFDDFKKLRQLLL